MDNISHARMMTVAEYRKYSRPGAVIEYKHQVVAAVQASRFPKTYLLRMETGTTQIVSEDMQIKVYFPEHNIGFRSK